MEIVFLFSKIGASIPLELGGRNALHVRCKIGNKHDKSAG